MATQVEIGSNEPSKVQEFYKDARIFITGASGFLGMLLIQKLIRDCSELSKIYVLIRHKKEKSSQERIDEMFNDPVFEKMKMEKPNYREKIQLITGDLEISKLGLNEDDWNFLCKEVNIVFHLAATVRFDEKIKKAAEINIRATEDIINLTRNCTNLKAIVHCSTAYSFSHRKTVDEQIYDTQILPERLLQITKTLNDDELEILTPNLLGECANTYVLTKCLAEKLLEEKAKGLPVTIIRPSMVMPTYKDPVDGWTNNMYGPLAISVAGGAGIVRVGIANPKCKGDMIPADYVINNIIVAAQYAGTTFNSEKGQYEIFKEIKAPNGIPIFNCISSKENPITWNDYRVNGAETITKWAPSRCIWYFVMHMCTNYYQYRLLKLLLDIIPAYIMDGFLYIKGKKPIFLKINKKVDSVMKIASYFVLREWDFHNSNTQALWNNLNNTDKKLFEFSVKNYEWKTYMTEHMGKGLRLYMWKDPMENLPLSRRRYKKLMYAHYTLKTVFYLILAYFVFRIIGMIL